MKYKPMGRSGVSVSELCFGTMSFGGDADEATSATLYRACREAGINFFDTANIYAGGSSEEVTGRALREYARRDEIVIEQSQNARTAFLAANLGGSSLCTIDVAGSFGRGKASKRKKEANHVDSR